MTIPVDELGRQRRVLDDGDLSWLAGKRVLVTGAGGSIGGMLCRQLASAGVLPHMVDRSDEGLCRTLYAIDPACDLTRPELHLVDIRDHEAIGRLFAEVEPDVVFHAAAQKDVVLSQRFPYEAVRTNVWGTRNVARAAWRSGVERFVNISTDKAADPANVMGATKRIAERIVAAVGAMAPGKFVSVRFGNVLGSSGSVVPVFRRQIAAGGPVTITDPDVERYFMTLDEAVALVLRGAVHGQSGQALVLDMGPSVRIADIVNQLMAEAGTSVPVSFTGLRPGEKLAEVLVGDSEVALPSPVEYMQVIEVPAASLASLKRQLAEALSMATPPIVDPSAASYLEL